jgi:hypothetical protein
VASDGICDADCAVLKESAQHGGDASAVGHAKPFQLHLCVQLIPQRCGVALPMCKPIIRRHPACFALEFVQRRACARYPASMRPARFQSVS